MRNSSKSLTDEELIATPAANLNLFLLAIVAVLFGTYAGAVLIPTWAPQLAQTLLGPSPKAYWFLARGSAIVAYLLLWLSMAFGLLITNKVGRSWPGTSATFDLHQFTSIAGLFFAIFHAAILLGDQYIGYEAIEIALPFASYQFKPLFVGLGQVASYGWMAVAGTFYVRKVISPAAWRLIHLASFAVFLLALVHGIFSGTDTQEAWVTGLYWVSGGLLLWLFAYRVISSKLKVKS